LEYVDEQVTAADKIDKAKGKPLAAIASKVASIALPSWRRPAQTVSSAWQVLSLSGQASLRSPGALLIHYRLVARS
jgi:hypothetical protein